MSDTFDHDSGGPITHAPTEPQRRARHFLWLGLIVLAGVIGVFIMQFFIQVRRNFYLMEELTDNGAFISTEPALPDQFMKLADQFEIEFLHQPTAFILALSSADRIDWAAVGQFKTLRQLTVTMSNLTDVEVRELSSLTQLESLNLMSNPITDSSAAAIAGMTRLRELNLASTQITDAGLPSLYNMHELYTLNLTGTQITDAGLADLRAALPNAHITH